MLTVLLDLDPNVVKPGWTPLLITVGLAVVIVLLFLSMRRQFRRIDDNFGKPGTPQAQAQAQIGDATPADPPAVESTGADRPA
jgi:uncharacterized membrane protein YdfJ with MMPL/SSD domain